MNLDLSICWTKCEVRSDVEHPKKVEIPALESPALCQWECCRVTESGCAGTTARSSRAERLPDYSSRQSSIRGGVLVRRLADDLAHTARPTDCSSASPWKLMVVPP